MQSDFDPVYPYDKEQFVISAPFVNTLKGLTTDPPGFIAIKAKPPLTFDNNGALEIVGGSNIIVNVDTTKGLTKSNDMICAKVASPIVFNGQGDISLDPTFLTPDESKGLKNENNKLVAKISTPLFFDQSGNITFNASQFSKHFTVGAGLTLNSGTLTLQLSKPLQFDQGNVSFSTAAIINTNKGLEENGGRLGLKITGPLTFTSSGEVSIDTNSLAPNFVPDTTKGLELSGGKLLAKIAQPITFDASGNITVNLQQMVAPNSGLQTTGNKLALKTASNLIIDSAGAIDIKPNTFASEFSVNTTKGLELVSSSLQAKVSAPLTFNANGDFGLLIAAPIILNNNGELTVDPASNAPNFTVNTNKGLMLSNSQLEAKVASPIEFNNSGEITLNDSNYAKLNVNNQFTQTQRIPKIDFGIGSVGAHSNTRDLAITCNGSAVFSGDSLILQSKIIASNANLNDLGGGLGLGWGSGAAYIVPEDNSNKTLNFSGYNGRGKFDLDMRQTSRIMNVMPPTADSDAVSKWYCDTNYVSKRSPNLGPVLTLTQQGNNVPLVSFNNPNGTRLGYVGLGPVGSLDTYLQGANNVYLQSLRNDGQIIAKNNIFYAGGGFCTLGNGIMFFKTASSDYCYMGGSNGNLYLRMAPPNSTNKRILLIDLERQTRIMNVPLPQDLTDVISIGTLRQNGVYGMMWTGGRPTANCKANGNNGYNIRLGLALAANGGMVNCSLFAEGFGPYATFDSFRSAQVVIKINFNSDGSLKPNCDLLNTSWGYRQGESVVQNIPLGVNLKAFMPNYLQYPGNGTSIPRNTIVKKVYLDASLSFTTFVKLNHESSGYSIWFVFDGVNDPGLRGRNFQLPTINFNYVGDYFNQ